MVLSRQAPVDARRLDARRPHFSRVLDVVVPVVALDGVLTVYLEAVGLRQGSQDPGRTVCTFGVYCNTVLG